MQLRSSGHYITENSSMELSDNVINKEIESIAKDVFEDLHNPVI